MEIREWCLRILGGDAMEEKLFTPDALTDRIPGAPVLWDTPSRPPGMRFQKHSKKDRLPPLQELGDPDKRAVCLHRFAGHELLAVEVMAYALLAFPEAPKHFRRGVAATLREEQEHVRLYIRRLSELGVLFGDLPLYKHFWAYTKFLHSPIEYISVMSLTLEMANLDFAPLYRDSFSLQGDLGSAALMERIFQDEISHVSFGMHWLNKMKSPLDSSWESWRKHTPSLLTVARAAGSKVQEEARKQAGIPEDWIRQLKQAKLRGLTPRIRENSPEPDLQRARRS